jgi:lipopolysaccharide export system permease protein
VRTLSRYFLASYLKLFVTILFASMVAIAIVEMLLNFDQVLDDHSGLRGVARYLFLRLPAYYFRDLIPVVSFAAAFFCIGLAARSREVMAAKTGGISPRRMVVPILLAATGLSATALGINETWVLAASRASDRSKSEGSEISFRRGSFWYHRGDTIYNVQEADPNEKTLHGVRVYETTPAGRLERSTRAEVVRIDDEHRWHMLDATVRTFDPEQPTTAPVVEQLAESVLAVTAKSDLALLDARAHTLSLIELREYIRARSEDGRDTVRYREMLHARLAEPLTVLAFALIAVPLGLAVERHYSLPAAAVFGIATLGVFYTAKTTASVLVESGAAAAAFAPWFMLTALVAVGALFFYRAPQ